MQSSLLSILKKYWGFDRFRPLQEDIILSVLQNNDTLALLPTGGGKSICFQVPAMLQEGVCIVVSPLIALMKDQVENLKKKGIRAIAIYSGMSSREVDIALDNCIYGGVKFLYLSPERLLSELVQERIARMKVCFFTVDEAHCISQWGYDFRPPYLRIAEIRQLHPDVPVIALTATATPLVRADIMRQLKFRKETLFQMSFARSNLSYLVYHLEDKNRKMVDIFSKVKGSGIVYVRNRKRTREYAKILQEAGISADFYHAGLTPQLRDQKQDAWKNNTTRVMVCTNAFGMGIDKPDVRAVVHMDLPDSLEAYYQEAGRAGRDEKPSFAVVLYHDKDIADIRKRQETSFPGIKEIRAVYQGLANYLQVPVDSGMGVSFDFDISSFITNYNFNPVTALACLRHLETEGLISVTDAVLIPSRIFFRVSNLELYNFQVTHPKHDMLIKTILRSTEGVFDDFARISEPELANRLRISYAEVVSMLQYLRKSDIIYYEPRKDAPQLVFTMPREETEYISFDQKKYMERKAGYVEKTEAVVNYVNSRHLCRSMILLSYFGETVNTRCGVCDFCRSMNKLELNELEIENFKQKIHTLLHKSAGSVDDLIEKSGIADREKALEALSWLVDQEYLFYNRMGLLELKKKAIK